ncbi:MAG: sporulation protein YqfD [Bacilli bacterium]|nr:sporulation protein YqfD [Bacilli bacterium]
MRNRTIENNLDSIIKVKIEGKNINNYIKRIIKQKINIIKLIPISHKEVHISIKYSDYKKIIQYKSIYKISIIDTYGLLKLKKGIKKNIYLIIFSIIGILLIIILSNITFSIDIIHQDKKIRYLIKEELNKYGLKKYHFKKNYKELETIEDSILKNNKDKLEWIEIINKGTKYIVRIEERKINNIKHTNTYQSIVSTKEAIITKIIANKGEKEKNINDYVKKGEPIISGFITLPDNTKIPTTAKGKVYGEVWYQVTLDYPFVYQEEKITGNKKTIFAINFINKRLSILDFKKYKTFKSKNKIIFQDNLITNINLTKEKQYELIVKDEVYPIDIAISKAEDYIIKKLKKGNPKIKKIKKIIILNHTENSSTINLKLFITAIENIGVTSPITEEDIKQNQNKDSNLPNTSN